MSDPQAPVLHDDEDGVALLWTGLGTADAREGLAAVIERREPRFTGR